MPASFNVARVGDLAVGEMRSLEVDGQPLLLCHADDGQYYAVEDVCSHDMARLGQGMLVGCTLVCPRHGATFDVRSGAALTQPAFLPLQTFPVTVNGGEVCVSLDDP